METIFNILWYLVPSLIFIFELKTFNSRKKGIQELKKAILKLKIDNDKERELVQQIANKSIDVFTPFVMLKIPFVLMFKRKKIEQIKDSNLLSSFMKKNKDKLKDFNRAIGLNIFYTSPTLYIIYALEMFIFGLLVYGAVTIFTLNNDYKEQAIIRTLA